FLTDMIRHFLILTLAALSLRADPGDLIKSTVLENDVAYLRVGNVGQNLPGEIQSAHHLLVTSNKLSGFVVDLRFAGGQLTEAATATADWLTRQKLPVAVLINNDTHGAA